MILELNDKEYVIEGWALIPVGLLLIPTFALVVCAALIAILAAVLALPGIFLGTYLGERI